MHNVQFAFEAALRVLVVGLLLGAGLPAVFALGIRALAYGQGGDAEVSGQSPHPVGKVLAGLAFAVVIAGVLLGLTLIVTKGLGLEVVFDPFPMIVDKK